MGKKSKAPSSEEKEMAPLYTDTACNRDTGIATWEGMYNLLEEENPRVMEVAATAGSNSSSEASITELACSFLHWIAARPKIIPYTNMVKLILDSVDIRNRQFKTQGQELTEILFLQMLNFISARRKKRKRRKTHQGNPDQEMEAVSDARLAPLRKISRKRKLLIAQSPASPENCKKVTIQAEWKQKAKEKAETIQGLTKLNWDYYWAYLVKSHSQWMTLKCIINSTEKMAPALVDSVFSAQLKSEVGQLTLLKQILHACDFKDQIQK